MGIQRRFIRDVFTGDLREVCDDPAGELQALTDASRERTAWMARRSPRRSNAWDSSKDYVNKGMSLKPEDATPERIAAENEAARRHGTGAYYDNNGLCHCPTRRSVAREMARPHGPNNYVFQDNDACYSDCAGR